MGVTAAGRAEQRLLHEQAAANLARWHTSSTEALGLQPRTDEHWWTCPMPAPNIYFSAISISAAPTRRNRARMLEALGPHARDPSTSLLSVCDTWDQLDLRTFGIHRRAGGTWLARPAPATLPFPVDGGTAGPAGGVDARVVPELRIERVVDAAGLAAFERMMVTGFGARPPIAPHDIHAPGILDDPAMHVLAGWSDDQLVACSMTYVTDVAGIYGVATLPSHRGRGHATAMTVAAAAVAPDRPSVLQPTAVAEPLYRRLGFDPLGSFSHWA